MVKTKLPSIFFIIIVNRVTKIWTVVRVHELKWNETQSAK